MFPAKGIYEANLDRLLTQLCKLYRTALVGKFDLAYNLYGLSASLSLQQLYKDCLLKYSDAYFLHEIDTTNGIIMTNTKFIDVPLFDKKVHELLYKLCFQAFSRLLYAYGNFMFGVSSTDLVYGAAQYTWDLYDLHCKE